PSPSRGTGRRRAAELENEPLTAPVTNRPPVKPAAVSDVNLSPFKMPAEAPAKPAAAASAAAPPPAPATPPAAPAAPAARPRPRPAPPVAASPPATPATPDEPVQKVRARKGTTRRQKVINDTPLVSDVNLQVFRMPDDDPPAVPDARPASSAAPSSRPQQQRPPGSGTGRRIGAGGTTGSGSGSGTGSAGSARSELPGVDTAQRDRTMQSMPRARKPVGPDRKRKLPTGLTSNVTGKLPPSDFDDDDLSEDNFAGGETVAFLSAEEMERFAAEEERRAGKGGSGKRGPAATAGDDAPRARPFSFDDGSGEHHEGEYDDF
ncbi:MAG: hypothetical protein AB7S36_21335, partial [Planctomycetota bacterium]